MSYPDAIIVTGAGRGLGKEVAINLAQEGIKILCVSKSLNCYTVADDIVKAGGRAEPLQLDFTNLYQTRIGVEKWCEKNCNINLGIVLNAGIIGRSGGILDSRLDDWEITIKTNLLGNLCVLQGALANMQETQYGRVVSIGGGGAGSAYPLFGGYAASKVAIVRIVENIAIELQEKIKDFSIIALATGAMKTEMLEEVIRAGAEIKTFVDISEPVNFITRFMSMDSEKAKYLSGKFVHVRDDLNSLDFKNKWLLRRIEQ